MKRLIAIDPGKFATKVAMLSNGEEKIISFRTKMEETTRQDAQGNSFIVQYGGKRLLVGEQASATSTSGRTQKSEELHKVCAYTALGLLADTSDEIIVALGCPLSVYENSEQRKAYKEFMFPSGHTIDITVNNVTKHLNVKKVIVLPESSGIIYTNPEYQESQVGVLDLGGLNLNAVVYDRTMPILTTLFCENLGGNVLTQELKNALSTEYSEDIPLWMMDEIVQKGYLKDNMAQNGILAGSKEFITGFKKKHIQKILGVCQQKGWNLRFITLVFVGGTSDLLRNEIKELLPAATIVEEPAFANVRGFLKVISE